VEHDILAFETPVPFNAVVLGIGHLQASTVGEDQHEVLHMMDTSSTAMVEILNNVLDMGYNLKP
jgi:hypothetical protein